MSARAPGVGASVGTVVGVDAGVCVAVWVGTVVGVDAGVCVAVWVGTVVGVDAGVCVAVWVGPRVVVGVSSEEVIEDEGVMVAGTGVAVGSRPQEISISRRSEPTVTMPGDFMMAY